MDTFMDKLAQRLTAQEMIKANTAADAEEMKKLNSQVKEYRDILEQMQKLMADGALKLENAKVDSTEINRLVEALEIKLSRKIDSTNELVSQMEEALDLKSDDKNEFLKQVTESLDTKFDNVNENVHKECVKVYRNVQAVIGEENAKQTEDIMKAVDGLKGKLSAILGVSIVALIAALGGVAFQVLVYLQII